MPRLHTLLCTIQYSTLSRKGQTDLDSTGPLLDQSSIVADFADTATQDNAHAAIHRFLDKAQGSVTPG